MTIFLGIWQLQRLDWKNKLITEFNELKDQKPLSLSMGKMKYPNIDEFTKVITLGTVDRSKKIFFPAKTMNGISGVRIASLMSDNHGNNYLIDEGWFEQSRYDYFKNNNEIINAEILGYIGYPYKTKMFTTDNYISSNEWYYYDLEQIQTFLKVKINQKFFIKNMSNYAENFLIPSSQNHNFSNNHLQYAITWFSLALALSIFMNVFWRKNVS